MKAYKGLADGRVIVLESGTERDLDPRVDLRRHSPTGFAWGYGGSGPAQLALAIACDVLADDRKALEVYQDLRKSWVSRLPEASTWGPIPATQIQTLITTLSH